MIYPVEVKEFIYSNYKGTSHKAMAEMVNKKFGMSMTAANVKNFYANHKLNSGLTGRFYNGQTSHNKGRKQSEYMTSEAIEHTKATRFKKGQIPPKYRPVGSERITKDGYIEIKVADPHTWRKKHRYVWEEANGPVPKGYYLIFLDQDRTNTSLDNLALVSKRQHVIINNRYRYSNDKDINRAIISLSELSVTIKDRRKNERANNKAD